ncbi:MAG: ACT domain-containing protein [Candidatus Thermoplasmatota archaeon]|nr:ACT domain-containing protein [Candidatus Thermoplasmatota archaeon]MBS3789384.1 ACT domain-containing protein [Candidatus Thermoplasmatota archaeon]
MTYYEIIKLKEDGKIEFPSDTGYDIGASKGAYFLLEISPEIKEARMERIALPGKELVEFEFILKNKPGVLSDISGRFADHDVNIMFNETEEVNSEQGILITVLDVSKMDTTLEKLKKEVSKSDDVLEVSVKELE